MRQWVTVALSTALCGASATAHAQGWVKMPNGSLAYSATYTTSGIFSCGNPRYYLAKCVAMANAITFTRGASSATITYNPVSGTLLAPSKNGTSQRFSLGSLQTSFVGVPRFPTLSQNVFRYFHFGIRVTTTSPMVASGALGMSFGAKNGAMIGYGSRSSYTNFTSLPVAPSPPPSNYRVLQIQRMNYPVLDPVAEVEQITASASVTPEPVTIAILGSGLIGVAGIARRRRRPEI